MIVMGVRPQFEIVDVVNLCGLGSRFYRVIRLILSVYESWQSQDTRGVGGGGIAAKFPHHRPLKRFGLLLSNPLHFPNDLILFERSLKDIIGLWHEAGILHRFKGHGAVVVNIEVEVPDRLDMLFSATLRVALQRIHPDVNIRGNVLVLQPRLEVRACGILGRRNSLNGFTRPAVPHEYSNPVCRLEVLEYVFRSR